MRSRPDILLDIDGVFANFIDGSLPTVKRIVSDLHIKDSAIDINRCARVSTITHADVRSYRMEEVCGLSQREILAWHARVKSPGYCAAIPAYDGAREAIAALQDLGNVHPVTFPWPGSPHWIIERETWLRDVLGIDPDLVVYTRQKHLVAGDIFVEDTTKYLVGWRQRHRDGVAIRMSRPYNVSEPFTAGVTVNTFEELVGEVTTALEIREQHHRELWNTD